MKLYTATTLSLGLISCMLAGIASADTPAPDFTLHSLQHRNLRLAEYRGNNVVLFFWSTWCRDCITALQAMHRLQTKFTKDKQPILWTIVINNAQHNLADVTEGIGHTFPVLNGNDSLAKVYGVEELPATIVIDRNGSIAQHREGTSAYDIDLLHADLRELTK